MVKNILPSIWEGFRVFLMFRNRELITHGVINGIHLNFIHINILLIGIKEK